MQMWQALAARTDQGRGVPIEIYLSLVDALYKDMRSLFMGAFAAAGTTLISAIYTGSVLLYLCSVAFILVVLLRAYDAKSYAGRHVLPMSFQEAKAWELRYAVGAAAHVALLGMSCLVAFTVTSDPFVHIFTFSATIAYMIGVSGRNFASTFLVTTQIVSGGVPLSLALVSMGGAYYAVFALVMVPFLISLKFISDRLRRVLLDAVISGREVGILAGRFDTALNNMPHGLCMFDGEGRLLVSNRRVAELLNVARDEAARRPSIGELADDALRGGVLSASEAKRFASEVGRRMKGEADGWIEIDTVDDRTVSVVVNRMAGGGSVVLFEDITERRRTEAKVNELARYDSVTSLFNRAQFRTHLDEAAAAIARRGAFAVHYVDLNEFKPVNDTLGHAIGDKVLCEVAARLRSIARDTDIVARLGGDEFAVLQYPVSQQKDAAALAERIAQQISVPIEVSGHTVVVGASVGIALAPRDGAEGDMLLKNADMALARAKMDGRSGFRFFEQGMDIRAQARRALQVDLRNALAKDEFEVHYQPLYNVHSGRISTCEALLRWAHPVRGMVPPGEFIPLAEEMGLISELGERVLEKACLECAGWPADVRVAVNFSAIQFQRGDLAQRVRAALGAANLAPNRLEIEITESIFLNDSNLTRQWFAELQEMGVRISLDDFGTGYSSLSYLHTYPLNKVKIDRSFLKGIETSKRNLNLLHGMARLAAELGLSVAVEGVETGQQLALVTSEPSVHEIQGWLFGKAMPAEDIRQRLAEPFLSAYAHAAE
ncbi:MAG: EAL domain-containing protein [Hyphomicrobiaceae bacterium]|nr:EAL domain-containing protein [Hyphomicrobiaceae bacterium]